MKRILLAALSLIALVMFGCAGDTNNNSVTNPNPNPFTPKGTVTGVLTDATTGGPIANAVVSILDKTATTNKDGLFTIANVPATTDATGKVGNPDYQVAFDLTNVNAAITSFNADPANTVKKALYPAVSYNTVSVIYTSLGEASSGTTATSTNHDTPVDGFVATMVTKIGKLDGNIKLQVANADLTPVAADLNVQLFDTSAAHHLIAQKKTLADGTVLFENVQANTTFLASADDGTFNKTAAFTSGTDGLTNSFLTQGAKGLVLTIADDTQKPVIIAVTPANNLDVQASAAQPVIFKFSEPIKDTVYTKALTENLAVTDGLWKGVTVAYLGSKTAITNFSLAWNAAHDTLTVTLPTVAASKYSVSIAGALANLTDAGGNSAAGSPKSTVTFTTSGEATVTAPVVTRTTDTTVDWKVVTNAVQYSVTVERFKAGLSDELGEPEFTSDTHFDLTGSPVFTAFTDNQVPVTYKVTVTAYGTNSEITSGVSAAPVTLNDTTKPTVLIVAPALSGAVDGSFAIPATDVVVNVSYSEIMNKGIILDKTLWQAGIAKAVASTTPLFAKFTANADTTLDILPTVKSVTNPANDGINYVVTLTFTQNATKNGTTDLNSIVLVAPATDVNGNVAAKVNWVGELNAMY
jgi:hypothetical protein